MKDPGVDGTIILKRIFKKWREGIEWINLALVRDRWWALVKAATSVRVP